MVFCALASAPWTLPLCCEANVHLSRAHWTALCSSQFVCTAECLYATPLLACRPSLCAARVACAREVYMPPHSWHHRLQGFYGLLIPWAYRLVGSTVCKLFMGWKVQLFSVFCPLSPSFAWFSKTPQFPLGPTCKGASQCTETPPVSGLPSSLVAQGPIQDFSIFSLCMSPSSSLPHFGELNPSPAPGGLGSSAVT